MEELFRFSVIRPATRASAAVVPLERPYVPPPPPAAPAPPPTLVARAPARTLLARPLPALIASRMNAGIAEAAVQPQPPKSFQDQLRDIIRSLTTDNVSAEIVWQRLEPIALDFVMTQAHVILTNDLWSKLQ